MRSALLITILLGTAFEAASSGSIDGHIALATRSIMDLQPFRVLMVAETVSKSGQIASMTLTNLNPRINAWFILTVDIPGVVAKKSFHIENPEPRVQGVTMDASGNLRLTGLGADIQCQLLPQGSLELLDRAKMSGRPYAPICDNRLFLRNAVVGHFTNLELATQFLRDHVWGGERVIGLVKTSFMSDAFDVKAEVIANIPVAVRPATPRNAPPAARVLIEAANLSLAPVDLGLAVIGADDKPAVALAAGQWYRVMDAPGVFLSAIQPRSVTLEGLDSTEKIAMDYLIAFDLQQFELGFALGTEHPRLGWSEHMLPRMRDKAGPGPDGFDNAAPLVRTGMISPALLERTVATFTGGFKREHGAFEYGEMAVKNAGSHYGFIEQGTVFSQLQVGLATIVVLDDGRVGMKTWAPSDDVLLPHIRHARQNGVALLERDSESGTTRVGHLVGQWAAGNWSGSKGEKQRTLRAGACIEDTAAQHFLIYGYFSTATPLAMARVFQAYGCDYAMHLDMNALEHTYLAVYGHGAAGSSVQHLIQGMEVVDTKTSGEPAPRFLAAPDNRDFFYLLKRQPTP